MKRLVPAGRQGCRFKGNLMKRAALHKDGQRPLKLFIELLLAILVVETLVMLLLHLFIEPLHLSATAEGLLDSFSLLIFLFPILYLLFYRPLSLEIAGYKQAQKDILGLLIPGDF